MHLFTYGSLMFDDVWQKLAVGQYATLPASLSGYARKCVNDDSYPVVFKSDVKMTVDGLLYLNVTPQDFAVLDEFEGEYYTREVVEVRLSEGTPLLAATYVLKDAYRHIASDQDWDVDCFANVGIHHFLERYGEELRA
ncbi:MAG TPA: gamma-glutamylcyclotransferase [Mariprofundaceae bacterium]|nr:gamma-glutamylcyclotransferase [Mariprofundaceae bacterium]